MDSGFSAIASHGTATPGEDYEVSGDDGNQQDQNTGKVRVPAGEMSATIDILVLDDDFPDPGSPISVVRVK